jgi:hypothetical protein
MRMKLVRLLVGLLVVAGCTGGEQMAPPATSTAVPPTAEMFVTEIPATATAVPPTNEPTDQPIDQPPATGTQQPTANADVTFVRAVQTGKGVWTFHVTVEHPDTGWDDYADGWDVVLPDGSVVLPNSDDPFTRLLLHPHETEQPFTRSQSNITIPPDVTQVTVRAHDLVDGFGGQEVVVDLTVVSGSNFEVER